MTISLRLAATWILATVATCAAPVFAQNNGVATKGYGAGIPAPVDRAARNRNAERDLLGAPSEYGSGNARGGNTDDAQRAALLDEQRMTITDGKPAAGKAPGKAPGEVPGKAPGAANGAANMAAQPGGANARAGLQPTGAAKNTYADPYTSKRSVYRSPW
jgi:hypothetical protein